MIKNILSTLVDLFVPRMSLPFLGGENAGILRRDPFSFDIGMFEGGFHSGTGIAQGGITDPRLAGFQSEAMRQALAGLGQVPGAGTGATAQGRAAINQLSPGALAGISGQLFGQANLTDPRTAAGTGLLSGSGQALGLSQDVLGQLGSFDPMTAAEEQFNRLDAILEPGRTRARTGTAGGLLASGRLGSTAGARAQSEVERAIEQERQALLADQFGKATDVQAQMAGLASGLGGLGLSQAQGGSGLMSQAIADRLGLIGAGAGLQGQVADIGEQMTGLGMSQRGFEAQLARENMMSALGIDQQMLAQLQGIAGISAPAGTHAGSPGLGATILAGFASGAGKEAGAAAGASMFSDRRLKTNIKKIGVHPLGVPRYSFTYLWGEDSYGVMAQDLLEVMPEAVTSINGYYAVDYGMIGGQ